MMIELRGVRYYIEHYRIRGKRPAVIILHGFMGSTGCFTHIGDALNNVADVYAVDLIGHGETDSPDDPARYTTEEQVQDLKELTERLSGEPVILLGYSMGGRLALQFASSYPQKIKALILESTSAGIQSERERAQRKNMDRKRADEISQDLPAFLQTWDESEIFQSDTPLPDDIKNQLDEIRLSHNPAGLQNSLIGFGTGTMPPLHELLPALEMPVLIVAGEHDLKFIRKGKELSRLIKNSRFETIPGAAHRVHFDNPEAYLEHIIDFITQKI